ncbi:MAG: hypothetical protein PHU36_09615 [Syntrophomonadaceae bacterium]|nr:hypothetical protein [Syntrophomonadaceae bacterium]
MKEQVFTEELSNLMIIIILIPDIFKKILIFESDEIDDFDIGFEEFWLKIKKGKNYDYARFLSDQFFINLREIYSISTSEILECDQFDVKHFGRTLIGKARNGDGTIYIEGCYKDKILKVLNH